MTSYGWPTWADIIAQEIPESYNYAQSGGGNMFISCQVTEAALRHEFTDTDLIMIMWSSVAREDRYIKGNWLTPGNIYTQNYYNEKFVKEFADDFGYLLRDINLITLTKSFLESKKLNYYFLNMSPLTIEINDKTIQRKYNLLLEVYKDTLDSILPDIFTLECNRAWPQHPVVKKGGQRADYHPSPAQHFGYLNKLFPEQQWSENTINFVSTEQAKMEKIRNFDDMIFKVPENRI